MKVFKQIFVYSLIGLSVYLLQIENVYAVPSFAREYNMSCSSCHANWPRLTEVGRQFKENGFKLDDDNGNEISKYLTLDKNIPISVRLNMRLLDKRTSKGENSKIGEKKKERMLKMRALHEVELFLAGSAGKEISFFVELEAEDEWPGLTDVDVDFGEKTIKKTGPSGTQIQVVKGYIAKKYNDQFQLHAGYASPFVVDGHNTVSLMRNIRHEWAISRKGFLPTESQFISVSGRTLDNLLYIASWSGNGGLEGKDPRDFSGRLAFDLADDIMFGGYYQGGKVFGTGDAGESEDNFRKYGIDLQTEINNLALNAIMGWKDEDGSEDIAVSLSFQHSIMQERFLSYAYNIVLSQYTKLDGRNTFKEGGVFITKFLKSDNAKAQLGWEGEFVSPKSSKESRYTAVVDLAF